MNIYTRGNFMSIVTRDKLLTIEEGERNKVETMLGFAIDSAHKTLMQFNDQTVEANSQEHFVIQMCTAMLMIAYRAEQNTGLDIEGCLNLAQNAYDEHHVRMNPKELN